ncbi:hypothetical protein AC481_05575, partial [miscellaneous Crenarchaeota group archaeon SMTZ-80]
MSCSKKKDDNYEWVTCNLCGADNVNILFHGERDGLVRCKICGLVYRNPWLRKDKQIEAYDKYYKTFKGRDRINRSKKG